MADEVLIVIPARYASTRLPGKPLADIAGKPMIQHVYERAKKVRGVSQVIVATDDDRIASVVRGFGGEVAMTSADLPSGTDRVAAVADQVSAGIYVNIQGDEPLISPKAVEAALALVTSGRYPMGTAMTSLKSEHELLDPNVVKVVADREDRALYFSRHPIPYSRGTRPQSGFASFRHVGIYVYSRDALMKFRALSPSVLELGEMLEQLRAMENGIPIGIAQVDFTSIGIDTPEDLDRVRANWSEYSKREE